MRRLLLDGLGSGPATGQPDTARELTLIRKNTGSDQSYIESPESGRLSAAYDTSVNPSLFTTSAGRNFHGN